MITFIARNSTALPHQLTLPFQLCAVRNLHPRLVVRAPRFVIDRIRLNEARVVQALLIRDKRGALVARVTILPR